MRHAGDHMGHHMGHMGRTLHVGEIHTLLVGEAGHTCCVMSSNQDMKAVARTCHVWDMAHTCLVKGMPRTCHVGDMAHTGQTGQGRNHRSRSCMSGRTGHTCLGIRRRVAAAAAVVSVCVLVVVEEACCRRLRRGDQRQASSLGTCRQFCRSPGLRCEPHLDCGSNDTSSDQEVAPRPYGRTHHFHDISRQFCHRPHPTSVPRLDSEPHTPSSAAFKNLETDNTTFASSTKMEQQKVRERSKAENRKLLRRVMRLRSLKSFWQ